MTDLWGLNRAIDTILYCYWLLITHNEGQFSKYEIYFTWAVQQWHVTQCFIDHFIKTVWWSILSWRQATGNEKEGQIMYICMMIGWHHLTPNITFQNFWKHSDGHQDLPPETIFINQTNLDSFPQSYHIFPLLGKRHMRIVMLCSGPMRSFLPWLHCCHQFPFPDWKFRVL